MEEMFSYCVNNGFAVTVAVYLLYERSKFNLHISENLVRVSECVERIETAINGKKI